MAFNCVAVVVLLDVTDVIALLIEDDGATTKAEHDVNDDEAQHASSSGATSNTTLYRRVNITILKKSDQVMRRRSGKSK